MVQWINLMNKITFLLRNNFYNRFRQWWVKSHLKSEMRNALEAYNALLLIFMEEDHEEFYNITRMTPE